MKRIGKDLCGRLFAYLLVIEPAAKPFGTRSPGAFYRCRCLRCGSYTTVRASCLKDGSTKSCGCLKATYLAHMKAGIPYDKTKHLGPREALQEDHH